MQYIMLRLASSNSKNSYTIAFKFSVKQERSVSAICEIMNINVDFRISVKAIHSVFFLKKTKTQIKLKPKFFWKIVDTLLLKMLWSWHVPKFREKYQCLVKLRLLNVLLGIEHYMNIRPAHFVNIWFTLNNPRFNKWFKGRRDRRVSNVCQIS